MSSSKYRSGKISMNLRNLLFGDVNSEIECAGTADRCLWSCFSERTVCSWKETAIAIIKSCAVVCIIAHDGYTR